MILIIIIIIISITLQPSTTLDDEGGEIMSNIAHQISQ